jgi:hypothetical protein
VQSLLDQSVVLLRASEHNMPKHPCVHPKYDSFTYHAQKYATDVEFISCCSRCNVSSLTVATASQKLDSWQIHMMLTWNNPTDCWVTDLPQGFTVCECGCSTGAPVPTLYLRVRKQAAMSLAMMTSCTELSFIVQAMGCCRRYNDCTAVAHNTMIAQCYML